MAHTLTNSELTEQRKSGQWSKTFLAIPEYHIVYTARLGTPPTITDFVTQINFTNGSGTLTNVLADMTLYVGTSAGDYDLGMCRIRKAPTSGIFYLGETSEINWLVGGTIYLTVVDDYSIWQKSISVDPVRMDVDIAYTNQHSSFDPVPIMGTHKVAKLINGTVSVVLGASADTPSWVIGSNVSSRTWSVSGATLNNANLVNPTATFTSTGTYLVYCNVTAANGKSYKGVRYVIIYDDAHPLIENFTLESGRYTTESGGGNFVVSLASNQNKSQIRKRSLVILCTENYAENKPHNPPSQIVDSDNIVAVGWISDIETQKDNQDGMIRLTVESASYWLKQIRDYPAGLELKVGTVAAWTEMASMTVQKAVWHFLHWRSTATRVMDVNITNDSRIASRYKTERANLWERIVQVATPTIYARPIVDLYGRLFVEIEPQMESLANRNFPVVMEITKDDIQGDLQWTRKDVTPLSMLFWSGIKVTATNKASSFFSMSPGHSYAHHGEQESQDNYLVSSQAQSNSMCACYYGWKNNPLDNISITFSNSAKIIGIAPRQYLSINLLPQEDPRGIGYNGNLIPREISLTQDTSSKFIETTILFEPVSPIGLSVDGDIPTMEDVDFSLPNIPKLPPSLPPLPTIPLPPSIPSGQQPKTAALVTRQHGIFYTKSLDLAYPIWEDFNNGIDADDLLPNNIKNMVVTPSGACYILTDNNQLDNSGYREIKRASYLGGEWITLFNYTYHDSNARISGLGVNPNQPDNIAFVVGIDSSLSVPYDTHNIYIGVNGVVSMGGVVQAQRKGESSYKGVAYYKNHWIVAAQRPNNDARFFVFDDNGAIVGNPQGYHWGSGASGPSPCHVITSVNMYFWGAYVGVGATDYSYTGNIDGTGIVDVINAGWDINPTVQGLSVTPTNTMGVIHSHVSYDNLSTWVNSPTPLFGATAIENCQDDWRFIFSIAGEIFLTMDKGQTRVAKDGNLPIITPTGRYYNIIRYIP